MQKQQTIIALALVLNYAHLGAAEGKSQKWQASPPAIASQPSLWHTLIAELLDKGMPYGALAASKRIRALFNDKQSKELSLKTMLLLIDSGYLYNLRARFASSDLEPSADDYFGESYYLYKAVENKWRGMTRWHDFYISKIKKDRSPKYQFHSSIDSYRSGELKAAAENLRAILGGKYGDTTRLLRQKTARTLARIYFEQQDYARALDIYDSYLLQLNPRLSSDYLEAAWNLYYLKKYPEALGRLYNLESDRTDKLENLEKYVLRALIYRAMCLGNQILAVRDSLDAKLGTTIQAIKEGVSLRSLSSLRSLASTDSDESEEVTTNISMLRAESRKLSKLSGEVYALSKHLYISELRHLYRIRDLVFEEAISSIASELIMLDEGLSFLSFEVERAAFNVDTLFQGRAPLPVTTVEKDSDRFSIHWHQRHDFWRDERLLYRAIVEDQCSD